jgi:acyl carrier protein
MDDTLARLAAVARATFRSPTAEVTLATTAEDLPGWDSLRHALFLMNLEREFAVRFTPDEMVELDSVGALVGVIDRLRGG